MYIHPLEGKVLVPEHRRSTLQFNLISSTGHEVDGHRMVRAIYSAFVLPMLR